MTPEIINWIFSGALANVTSYMQGPIGSIMGSYFGIVLFIMIIGLIVTLVIVIRGKQ